ncbi:MAG: PorP/SprF family type IX secretion system membrane protein [Prolixibacteraceae bacterium]|jgi:type IX secretion system PorP/SprF family membrane protein|nr:PorP/SprF family type IX secretion system membrane protein [Prolixibacteraceae bacterium]
MKKKISFFILFILVILAAKAQQEPTFSNYMFLKPYINAGFTGAEKTINASIVNSNMFVGMGEGRPTTSVFGVEAPFEMFGTRNGIGLFIMSDELGFQRNVNVNLSYAHHHKLRGGNLSGGISVGIMNYNIVTPEWIVVDTENDEYIPNEEMSQVNVGINVGAFYETSDYSIGLSATNLNLPKVIYANTSTLETNFYFYQPNVYLMGAYNIALPDPLFDLQPTFLLSTDLAAYEFKLNATMFYNKKYRWGLGIKIDQYKLAALTVLAGMELMSGLDIGYAMNINNALIMGGATSHEVLVTYSFNLEGKRDQKYKSIRYL